MIDYLKDIHWVWYAWGFIICPRLTIMIALSIYASNIIPLPLMILGWVGVALGWAWSSIEGSG